MNITRIQPLPWLLFLLQSSLLSQPSQQSCTQSCGRVEIPYPFGLTPNCSLPGFQLSCDRRRPPLAPLLLLPGAKLRVLDIFNGELRVDSSPFIASQCAGGRSTVAHLTLPRAGPFTVSGSSNRFVAIGCDTAAVISDGDGAFTSGCVSLCNGVPTAAAKDCSGVGCCEAAVPYGRRHISLVARSIFGYANVSAFDNCSYSFVSENKGYEFRLKDLSDFKVRAKVSARLEWAIGDGDGCSNAYFCGENGYCVASPRGSGYICNCLQGFKGNPYLNGSNGCQDVNECLYAASPCVPEAFCQNLVPGYKCSCPFGTTGDGMRDRSGCRRIFPIVGAILGIALVIGSILIIALWIYFALKRRSLFNLREQYFKQNGGLLLKQKLSTIQNLTYTTKIFSSEELQRATAGYSDNRKIGCCNSGTVYRGILRDKTTVAIRKSGPIDRSNINQFINEVIILSQTNHLNIVKLLGCCLQTKVPMLVYELTANESLYKQLHEKDLCLSWKDRLRIAIETAEGLAYLHSTSSISMLRRDVKSSNILLDDCFTAKISDFSISRHVVTDYESFEASQLSAKSDVFSFGVVLVELLTGQKPVSVERMKEDSNLAVYFLACLECKELREFIDEGVMREGRFEHVIAVAELARKCLLLRGEKMLANMKEVAEELRVLAKCWRNDGSGEIVEEDVGKSLACWRSLERLDGENSILTNV